MKATAARFDEPEPAATLRSRTAGSQDESHRSAIHKFKSNVKDPTLRVNRGREGWGTRKIRTKSTRKSTGRIACATGRSAAEILRPA